MMAGRRSLLHIVISSNSSRISGSRHSSSST
jgi:hypothetical protein